MSTDIKNTPKEVTFAGVFTGLKSDGSGKFENAGTVILTKKFYRCVMANGRIHSLRRATSDLKLLYHRGGDWYVQIGEGPWFKEKTYSLLKEKYLQLVELAETTEE
jgi:hypothetical protein